MYILPFLRRSRTVLIIIVLLVIIGGGAYMIGLTESAPTTKPTRSHQKLPAAPTAASKKLVTPPSASSPTPQMGWRFTVYYTPVERFHHDALQTVYGCKVRDCTNGSDNLGSFPGDFIEKVKAEGTGKTANGGYLNWAYDTGYWLDSIPTDSNGNALQPFASAAADDATLAQGTRFRITDCSAHPDEIDVAFCQQLKQSQWQVVDHFTPGLGGAKHIDLYIGEEDQEQFEASKKYITITDGAIEILTK